MIEMRRKGEEAAYPSGDVGPDYEWDRGLTRREYFAARALIRAQDTPEDTAKWAVACADALIAELEKKK